MGKIQLALWTQSELLLRDAALSANVGSDGSSRETLADYGNPTGAHRFRLIRRESTGIPETHADIVDLVYIQSGQGTLQVGGGQVSRPGGNTGGARLSVAAGDIIHIPATYPHAYLVPEGGAPHLRARESAGLLPRKPVAGGAR